MKYPKILAILTTALLAIGLGGVGAVSASAAPAGKVVVCKYVKTPGVSEVLDHIIIPNANSLSWFAGTFPALFSDAHEKSVAIRYATAGEQAKDVALSECPAPTPPVDPEDASAAATPTNATCEAPGGVNFSLTNATWQDELDVSDGSRVAVADDGHKFAGGASTMVVTYTLAPQLTGEECAPPVDPQDASAAATPTEATCEAPGGVNFSLTNATWQDELDVSDGSRVAVADDGHKFAGGASTMVVTYTLAPQLTGEECAPPVDPQDASAAVFVTSVATCEAPGVVEFSLTNATWENDSDVTDGTRVAIADAGHKFRGGNSSIVVTYTSAEQLGGDECQLETHDLLSTSASSTNIRCDSSGSYTLANTPGVRWMVDGTEKSHGTYAVNGASTVNVEAQLIDSVENGWEYEAQTEWTFNFTYPEDCLTTLAYTGADDSDLGLLLASGFLLLGGAIVAYERRFLRSNAR